MSYTDPAVNEFKEFFVRDFPYGEDVNTNVLDADIARAISEADIAINDELFVDQDNYTHGFLYLAAHYLVTNLQSSSQGINGGFSWLQNSRSVGSVSEGISIPDVIAKNPMYSFYTKTNYGARYLMMIYPVLMGQVFTVQGGTRP